MCPELVEGQCGAAMCPELVEGHSSLRLPAPGFGSVAPSSLGSRPSPAGGLAASLDPSSGRRASKQFRGAGGGMVREGLGGDRFGRFGGVFDL